MFATGFFAAGFFADGFFGEEQKYSAEVNLSLPRLIRTVREIAPKVRKIIKRIARKAAETPVDQIISAEVLEDQQETAHEYATDAQESPLVDYWQSVLVDVLSDEQIAWNAFYASLLQQQINDQITAQIRRLFEATGVYQEIEDDEQVLMMMMMEL